MKHAKDTGRDVSEHRSDTLGDLLRCATARLRKAGITTPRLDAEVLLRHALGVDRTRLFLRLPEPAYDKVTSTFNGFVQRRLAGKPVAYITGTREFMGLPFIVTPDVLIPRPETELLVEWALTTIGDRPLRVVDVGTGSGAIALSVAALAPDTARITVTATDVSAAALDIARRNRDRIARRHPVTFVQGSLAGPVEGSVDLLLANLPYLTPAQIAGNADLDAEPRIALDGGADGLDLVARLIDDLPRVLVPDGAAGFELDPDQCGRVRAQLAGRFPGHDVRTVRDLAGRERLVVMVPG